MKSSPAAASILWLVAAMFFFIIAGAAGDSIFDPKLMNFSFRVFSDYIVAILLLITAGIVYNR